MVLTRKFLLALLFCCPFTAFGLDMNALVETISSKTDISEAIAAYQEAVNTVMEDEKYKDKVDTTAQKSSVNDIIAAAKEKATSTTDDSSTDGDDDDADDSSDATDGNEGTDTVQDEQSQKQQAYDDAKQAYEDAKANEQSTANKTLTALTTAATGIGGMELAMGLSEKKADAEADANMDAYIETMRCTYGDGKQVKAGVEEIELPGGNDPELMKLRNEYVALAASLKERKEALGMKPGIEAEEILDKANMGLYDDENIGITGGAYASLYRAKFLESEKDQEKIDAERKASKNRVTAGAVLVGVGIVGGIVGNSLINGKLGEKIKELKAKRAANKSSNLSSVLDKAGDIKSIDTSEILKMASENGISLTPSEEQELEE